MNQEKENKEDIDLSDAPKDSDDSDTDAKTQEEQQRSEEVFLPGTPKVTQWVIRYSGGLIKDEKQAQYVIFGFVALAIVVALVLIFNSETREVERNINPETGEEFIPGQIPGGI